MTYNYDQVCKKLEGVQSLDPRATLTGDRGVSVIANVCAANNISMQQPQPAPAATVESFLKPANPGGMS